MFKRKNHFNKPKRLQSFQVIENKYINQLANEVSLLDVISQYVPLKKVRNGDIVGRCPICRATTKNNRHFRLSIRKNIFKCFECGVGGKTIFQFLQRVHKLPFDKAFRLIIKMYNPDFKYEFKKRTKYKFARELKEIRDLKFKLKMLEENVKTKISNITDEVLPF